MPYKRGSHLEYHPMEYPWDLWFKKAARQSLTLEQCKDFLCQPHSMAVQFRTAAAKRDWVESVSITIDGTQLEITSTLY